MKSVVNHITLFDYLDYRNFLKDWYAENKAKKPSFSFRVFSRRGGFSSPNILKRVMEGQRSLTDQSVKAFCKALALNQTESQFFKNLVLFNQAKSHKDRDFYFQALMKAKAHRLLKPLEMDQYEYYSTWYHPVIRELVSSSSWDGKIESLRKRIFPKLSLSSIKSSIALLERMGFIQKTKSGQYHQTETIITTGVEATQLSLHNYHQNLLKLVSYLLNQLPANERDVSAITLGVNKNRFQDIKLRVQAMRRQLLSEFGHDQTPEDVVLLSMQLLPLTAVKKSKTIAQTTSPPVPQRTKT